MEKYIDLRLELESMASQQLAERLREETGKAAPDDDLVLLILGILEERDANKPVQLGPKSEEAWKVYQQRVKARARKPVLRTGWLVRAAIIVLAATILFAAIPQEAQADSFWDMLIRWTSDVVEFFSPNDNEGRFEDYQFTTDNPGLQQVYDAVVEMGVTEPVVPMWLLDNSKLVEIKKEEFPVKKYVHSRFESVAGDIIYHIDIYQDDMVREYQKDETLVKKYETGGTCHYIMRNNDRWSIIWSRDNVECYVFVSCQEDTTDRIINSIYDMEEN